MSRRAGPRATLVRRGPLELLIVDLPDSGLLPAALTAGERSVVLQVVEGASNREIERARGTSERTVANQLTSAYRKLGVFSRLELAALVTRSGLHEEPLVR
jgi:DNA-binding CsgD family transcriptional regulator